jgi:hypothetical protein
LFLIKSNPTEQDRDAIVGKFKSFHNASSKTAGLMANTFFKLLSIADLPSLQEKTPVMQTGTEEKKKIIALTQIALNQD